MLGLIRLHQPDAILCAGFFEPEVLAALQQAGKPIVLVDMHRRGFTSVNPDNLRGGYLVTQHLLQGGRKRIAMLSGSLAHYSIQQRNSGLSPGPVLTTRCMPIPTLMCSCRPQAKATNACWTPSTS